jgi:hypothetical protein
MTQAFILKIPKNYKAPTFKKGDLVAWVDEFDNSIRSGDVGVVISKTKIGSRDDLMLGDTIYEVLFSGKIRKMIFPESLKLA